MPILLGVREATEIESMGDQNERLRQELSRELAAALERLREANTDVQEMARTAMELARRLDDSENRLVPLQAELDEMKKASSQESEIIARQKAYIQRLRDQIGHPEKLLVKKVLRPLKNMKGQGR